LKDKSVETIEDITKTNFHAKKKLSDIKEWTMKNMVYSNIDIPSKWQQKQDYKDTLFGIINNDKRFSDFISSNKEGIKSTEHLETTNTNANNKPLLTSSDFNSNPAHLKTLSSMRYNRDNLTVFTETNNNTTKSIEFRFSEKKDLPSITTSNKFNALVSLKGLRQTTKTTSPNNLDLSLTLRQSNSTTKHSNTTNNFIHNTEEKNTSPIKTRKTKSESYGPYLNNQNVKKIEINNPKIKHLINECEGYGPYYSRCPMCNNKNFWHISRI